jgi:hypothetical protein
VPDHPLDRGEALAERPLHLVDLLVHVGHPERGIDQAMEIDDLAVIGLAHAHVVHLSEQVDFRRDGDEGIVHFPHSLGRRIAAALVAGLQRLDVGFDLDFGPQLVAHRLLEAVGDLVRAAERQAPVHFEVERDRQSTADRVHGDMMDGEPAVARDHHDPLEHGLVVESARFGVDGGLGLRE